MGGFFSGLFGTNQPGQNPNDPSLPYNTDELRQQLDFSRALQSNQNALAQQLVTQSQGGGPNPALAQLSQTTNDNNQQAASLLASQRGLNPALAARMAAEQGATSNQHAAGQAAILRANQQLAAQRELGGLYGQQGQQVLGQQDLMNRARLGTQAVNANINSGNQGASMGALGTIGSIFSSAAPMAGKLFSGGGGGGDSAGIGSTSAGGPTSSGAGVDSGSGGGATYAANGGAIQAPAKKYAAGGAVNPYDSIVAYNSGLDTSVTNAGASAPSSGGGGMGSMLGGMGGMGGAGAGSALGGLGTIIGGIGYLTGGHNTGDKGGNSATVGGDSPKDGNGNYVNPHSVQSAGATNVTGGGAGGYAKGGEINTGGKLKAGGKVPGKAKVKGDSYSNDFVNAKLSPGEEVIDRETMQDPGQIGQMARFVAAHIAQKNGKLK